MSYEDVKHIKLHNNFKIFSTNIYTGETKEVAYAENIVLDKFKTLFADRTPITPMLIAIGTGTSDPLPTDTSLGNEIYRADSSINVDLSEIEQGGTGVVTWTGSIRIQADQLIGQAISEIGLVNRYRSNGNWRSNELITKAKLMDSNGNPIIINKTSLDILDIYGTAYMVIPKTIDGMDVISRVGYVTNIYSGAPGFSLAISDAISFRHRRTGYNWSDFRSVVRNDSFSGVVTSVLDPATNVRTYSVSEVPVGSCNIGGVRAIVVGDFLEIPVPNETFTQSVINKELVGTGDGVKKTFGTKFGWIRDNGTFKVFINDVEQSGGFTVKYNQPPSTSADNYFEKIEGQEYSGKVNYTYYTTIGTFIAENKTGKRMLKYSGEDSLNGNNTLHCSNNLVDWISIGDGADIPEQYKDYPYWKSRTVFDIGTFVMEENEIVFDTPPDTGAVITVTYQPDCIAKDENKILRNMTYKFGV